jgi:hypothetical protein
MKEKIIYKKPFVSFVTFVVQIFLATEKVVFGRREAGVRGWWCG